MADPTCDTCGGDIELFEQPLLGELIDCTTCGAELEVTGLEPVEVRAAPELAEDWGE